MPNDDCEYDIVLWGATGFTGQLVAEHLAGRYDTSDLDWAIAGRNRAKLTTLREELTALNPDWDELDIVTGDAFDRDRLDTIAGQTRVVCTTVGPYAKYGANLVEACIESGTDYCDFTAEVHWARVNV